MLASLTADMHPVVQASAPLFSILCAVGLAVMLAEYLTNKD